MGWGEQELWSGTVLLFDVYSLQQVNKKTKLDIKLLVLIF